MDNFFSIFDMMGVDAPSKQVVKKETKTKKQKPATKSAKKETKNIISLPTKVVIQDIGTINISPEDLNNNSEISNIELQRYLNEKYPVTNYMDNILEKDIYFYGINVDKSTKGPFKVDNSSKIIMGNTIINLGDFANGDLSDSEATSKDLAEFAILSGLFLGNPNNVSFVENKKDNVLIPIPASITDQDIKDYKIPITISFTGDWDDIVIYDEIINNADVADNLTLNNIEGYIIQRYPELTDRILFTGFSDNTIYVHVLFIKKNDTKKKKGEQYSIDSKTIVKYYGNTIELNLPEGDYTLQEISKALVKAGIDECKGGIVAKKTGNILLTGAKFGGTKGALSPAQLNIIRSNYSTFELEDEHDIGYLKVHPAWLLHINDGKFRFSLRLPKIPCAIYNSIVSLFKTVATLFNKECLARIYWDIEKNQYDLRIPYQEANIASVVNTRQEDDYYLLTHIPVVEVHSHGRAYDAFFSSIDDDDEKQRYGLFGVFSFKSGINEKENCIFRCCSGSGRQVILKKEDIFESGKFLYTQKYVENILSSNRLN